MRSKEPKGLSLLRCKPTLILYLLLILNITITISEYSLEMQLYKSFMFSPKYTKSYSELDFLVKFWSPVMEEYLNYPSLTLHWGETKAKSTKTDAKLDLRILSAPNTLKTDLAICEFAKTAISSKLYYDKIKTVLLTKYQLNSWVAAGVSPQTIQIPIIQVMGLVCQVMVLRCKEEGVYVLEPVSIFRFPSSIKDIRENGIRTLIDNLEYIKVIDRCILYGFKLYVFIKTFDF
jgi:hypothetical protein